MSGFTIDDTGTILEKYSGNEKCVVIPEGIEEIGRWAFLKNSIIEEITFPSTLKKIGDSSFEWCTAIKTIEIPDSVKHIDQNAFYRCEALQSVSFSEGLEEIGTSAFEWCSSLKDIILPASIKKIGSRAFSLCDGLVKVIVLGSDTYVGEKVFEYCANLKRENCKFPQQWIDNSINLPFFFNNDKDIYSYLGIGDENGCIINDGVLIRHVGGQKEITITEGVHTIDSNAFTFLYSNGRAPEVIHLPKTVRKAEDYVLNGMTVKVDPAAYKTREKLIKEFSQDLDNDPENLAYVSLFQSGKKWTEAVARVLEKTDVNEVAKRIIEVLSQETDNITDTIAGRAVTFLGSCSETIDPAEKAILHELLNSNSSKWKKAIKAFEKIFNSNGATAAEEKKAEPKKKSVIASEIDEAFVFPTDENDIIENAINLYITCYKELRKKLDGSSATVIETPSAGAFAGRARVEAFYSKLRDFLNSKEGIHFYDDISPDKMYGMWTTMHGTFDGQVGLSLTLGFTVAEYALSENKVTGNLVYCRDKWEYRGDYSSRTRPALHIEPNQKKWKVYSKKGYDFYDM